MNLEPRPGYLNRHTDGLPSEPCTMKVINYDVDGEAEYLCSWQPFHESQRSPSYSPYEGYLGSARIVAGRYAGIGFNVWQQNDSEFVYYAIVQ